MTKPPQGTSGTPGTPLAEGDPKKPWHSKKWTYAMWVTTLLCGILVFYLYSSAGEHKDMVVYVFLGLITSIAILTIGGVYALDKYRMGLVQIVEAARGKDVDEGANAVPPPQDPFEGVDDPDTASK